MPLLKNKEISSSLKIIRYLVLIRGNVALSESEIRGNIKRQPAISLLYNSEKPPNQTRGLTGEAIKISEATISFDYIKSSQSPEKFICVFFDEIDN